MFARTYDKIAAIQATNERRAPFTKTANLQGAKEKREPGNGEKGLNPRNDRNGNTRTGDKPRPDKPIAERVRLCFHCGQPGHIASNPECPENGKKPSYAQICVAHTIILDAMSETVGAEEHPGASSSEDDAGQHSPEDDCGFNNVDFEIYDAGSDDECSSSDDQMNYIGSAIDTDSEHGGDEIDPAGESGEEIVYANPMAELDERMETVPLFEFSRLLPDVVYKSNMEVRMSADRPERPSPIILNAMTEAGTTVLQPGRVKLRIQNVTHDRPTPDDKQCLVTMLQVNGLEAVTLWDSGSTSMAMSPAFADISKALVHRLWQPVTLQLGMVGS